MKSDSGFTPQEQAIPQEISLRSLTRGDSCARGKIAGEGKARSQDEFPPVQKEKEVCPTHTGSCAACPNW